MPFQVIMTTITSIVIEVCVWGGGDTFEKHYYTCYMCNTTITVFEDTNNHKCPYTSNIIHQVHANNLIERGHFIFWSKQKGYDIMTSLYFPRLSNHTCY